MNDKEEVARVKHEDGYMVINKKDFDKTKHELYEVKKKKQIKKKDK